MKKSTKRFWMKMVTGILSMVLAIGIALPLQVLATTIDSTETVLENTTINSGSSDYTQNIIKEIEEERDEFTKVFLLSDGSYCSITTTNPIHQNIDDSWEEIANFNNELPETITECAAEMQLMSETNSNNISTFNVSNAQTSTHGVCINTLDSEPALGGGVIFTGEPVVLVKPTSIDEYIFRNRAIIDARLSVYCTPTISNNATYAYVSEETAVWDAETSADDYDFDSVIDKRIMDYKAIDATGTYTWDITDIYSRWERGITENNGLILYGSTSSMITMNNFCFIVIYKDVSPLDNDFTYHTTDMDRAGTLYINDFSNTVTIEQDILNIENSVLPISIKRSFSSVNPSFSAGAGIGFSWNYDSSIVLTNNTLTWKLFDGTTKHFIQTNPIETNGEYQKWTELASDSNSGEATEAWIKPSEISNATQGYSVNYSNIKINIGKTIYSFNQHGKLTQVLECTEVPFNIESTIGKNLVITYNAAGNITNIKDTENRNFVFTYKRNNTGYDHISNITVKNADNEVVTFTDSNNEPVEYKINFSTTYSASEGIVFHTTTFEDGSNVTYKYDVNGNLYEIIDNNAGKHTLTYKFNDATHKNNIITCYEKTITNAEGMDCRVDYLKIYNQNTYQRYFSKVEHINADCGNCNDVFCTANNVPKELIQYDRHFNVTTHKDAQGNSVFAKYGSDNIVESFALNENISSESELLSNPSFDDARLGAWRIVGPEPARRRQSTLRDHGKEVYFSGRLDCLTALQQIVTLESGFSKNSVYVVGAYAKASTAIPYNERFFGIKVYASNVIEGIYDEVNEILILEEAYDTTVINEWQEKLVAFQLPDDYTSLKISLEFCDQQNEVTFEDATLYEATNAVVNPTDGIGNSPIIYTYNSDSSIYSEMMTNGTESVGITYNEYVNGFVTEKTDHNGNKNYYEYDNIGNVVQKGTVKSNSEISDAISYVYEGAELLAEVSQTISSIETADKKTVSTTYSRTENKITSVLHNGFSYNFTYDNGNLTSIKKVNVQGEESNYATYNYENNSINKISYDNNFILSYDYDDTTGNISEIIYSKIENETETILKKYQYEYDPVSGKLISVYDTNTGYLVEFSDNMTTVSQDTGSSAPIKLYTSQKNAGGTYETYLPELYCSTDTEATPYNTVSKGIPTISTDSNGSTTKTTNINTTILNANTSDGVYNYDYICSDVTDYFNRLTSKRIDSTVTLGETESHQISLYDAYSYKTINTTTGLSSGLISVHNSLIGRVDDSDNVIEYYSNLTYYYDYDHKGNIISIIIEDEDGNFMPYAYYGYDEANQVVYEVNFPLELAVHYTYDNGGNLIKKTQYDLYDIVGTNEDNTQLVLNDFFTQLGINKDNYNIQSVGSIDIEYSGDTLTSFAGIDIESDALSNPKHYYGTNLLGEAVEGTLEWSGNRLTKFYNNEIKLEFEYDANGYRTCKRSYEKAGTEYELIQEYTYIWENGLLKGTILGTNTDTPVPITIIYDDNNLPIGIVSPSGMSLYYQKDIHGNIIGLLTAEGEYLANVYYDAWGNFYLDIQGDNSLERAINAIIVAFNPCMYHGYLYDYELGLYFNQGRCYSPAWGRYLNSDDPTSLLETSENPLDSNLYLFCKNNAVNEMDKYGSWSQSLSGFKWTSNGFEVAANPIFISKAFSMIFANEIIKKNFAFSSDIGSNYLGMNSLRIASNLYAHSLAKYSPERIEPELGKDWSENAQNSNTISVTQNDKNAWKYKKIWYYSKT